MAVEGTLDLFRLPEILQLISQQGKTGILTVQGQQDIVAVSFLGGRIVAADALTQTVEEGLAQVLVSERLVSAADFARAAADNQAAGGRLLDALVERGLVTRAKLLEALRLQTKRQLQRLLRWDQGDFKFYSGDEVSYEEGFLPISVEDLLLDSLEDFADLPPAGPAPLPGAAPSSLPGVSPQSAPSPQAASVKGAPLPSGGTEGFDHSEALAATKVFPAPPASQVFPVGLPSGPPRAAAPSPPSLASSSPWMPSSSSSSSSPLSPFPPSPAAGPAGAGAARGGRDTATRPLRVVRSPAPVEPPFAPPPAAIAEHPLPRQFRKMEVARSRERLPAGDLAAALLLAALLAGAAVVALLRQPATLTVPFPWQAADRAALAQEQQQALYAKIERASKTFYLLEGRFPDRLQQLAAMGLLSPSDFEDPERRPLEYLPREDAYTLRPLAAGRPLPDPGTTETITGNFLLDPQLLVAAPPSSAPIVLLD